MEIEFGYKVKDINFLKILLISLIIKKIFHWI